MTIKEQKDSRTRIFQDLWSIADQFPNKAEHLVDRATNCQSYLATPMFISLRILLAVPPADSFRCVYPCSNLLLQQFTVVCLVQTKREERGNIGCCEPLPFGILWASSKSWPRLCFEFPTGQWPMDVNFHHKSS